MNTTIEVQDDLPATLRADRDDHEAAMRFHGETDDALAQRLNEAQARLANARPAADEAGRLENEAAAAFAATPSAASHTNSAVQAQLAVNARDKVREHEAEVSELAAEQLRRERVRRLLELTPVADSEALIAAAYERFRQTVAPFLEQIEQQTRTLHSEIAARNAANAEMQDIERELGLTRREQRPPMNLHGAHIELAGRLRQDFRRRAFALEADQVVGGRYVLRLSAGFRFDDFELM